MTIYLQRSVPIQPRTSLGKSDVSWPSRSFAVARYAPARRTDLHGAAGGAPPADQALRQVPALDGGLGVRSRVEKFDGPAIEPIELLNIRIRVEILSEFRKFCQNSSEIQKFEDLSTFSKLFIEILRNSH